MLVHIDFRSTIIYQPLEQEIDIDAEPAVITLSIILTRGSSDYLQVELMPSIDQVDRPLTMKETARMALGFCFLWFIANWALNAALAYTSVASSTILSGMSGACVCTIVFFKSTNMTSLKGMFTLAVGRMFRVETLTLVKIGAVLTGYVVILFYSWMIRLTGLQPALLVSSLLLFQTGLPMASQMQWGHL